MRIARMLILVFLVNGVCHSQKQIDCQQHRNGFFVYDGKHTSNVVYRKNDYQIEYNVISKQWVTVQLHWIKDCKYYFTYFRTTEPYLIECIGKSMLVYIVTSDAEGYEYKANYNNGEKYFEGRLISPKTALTKKLQRTIKRKLRQKNKKLK